METDHAITCKELASSVSLAGMFAAAGKKKGPDQSKDIKKEVDLTETKKKVSHICPYSKQKDI